MPNHFFISDHHFGHANILTFANGKGDKLRPQFRDVFDMNEFMVEKWNSVVRPHDHVHHLGDVAMRREHLDIVKRLNGHKRLVFGNHDIFDYGCYIKAGFKKLMAYRVMDGLIFSHIPIHPNGLQRFKLNVHGHLHANRVTMPDLHPDPRYLNVSVEQVDYTPVDLEWIRSKITT